MPQMAPYNWIMMFIMFNMIMLTYSSYNNFFKIPLMFEKKKMFKINYNWMW